MKYQGNYTAEFRDGDGKKIDGEKGISPLFAAYKNQPIFIGTAFFISRNGLLLTAKHCLTTSKGESYESLFIAQILDNNQYIMRPIDKSIYNESDIAILVARSVTNNKTGKQLINPVPTLTIKRPNMGEMVGTYSYPMTNVTNDQLKKHSFIRYEGKWSFGEIEDFHPAGTHLLKNSCFQTSMFIEAGSSGGPVANSKGKIFAINSTGADVDDDLMPYSFLTPIEHCLNLRIHASDRGQYSIFDLINLNQILCEF